MIATKEANMRKELSPEYNKLCAMLRELAAKDGLQLSDDEICKGAGRLMGYVELAIRVDYSKNNKSLSESESKCPCPMKKSKRSLSKERESLTPASTASLSVGEPCTHFERKP